MKALLKLEKEISIKAPWGKIAALAWGNPSSPAVLLCHGMLDSCSSFRPLVQFLPDCFYYVSIDLPGNGRSDQLPKGVRYTVVDLVPTIVKVMEHYQWKSFRYIGHSLGVPIGKIFNMVYPGHIISSIELDPVPAHHNWPSTREGIQDWYHDYYGYYEDEKYRKYNGSRETAPKYSYEKAQQLIMHTRNISEESSKLVLERCLEPAGDGLYRFTFDQRMKEVSLLPFSAESLKNIYTTTETPTFTILSKDTIDLGIYKNVPFVMDSASWIGQYKWKTVDGGHDIHLNHPESLAKDVGEFLMEEFKSKL